MKAEIIDKDKDTISIATEEKSTLSDILGDPIVSISSGEKIVFYYSSTQIEDAYNAGVSEARKEISETKKKESCFSKIRELQVGDYLLLPKKKWNAARSAASKLKTIYGATFVTKLIKTRSKQVVRVTRTG